MAKKVNPLDNLVQGRGNYVVNQKAHIFADKRTKRNRDRASQKRNALREYA